MAGIFFDEGLPGQAFVKWGQSTGFPVSTIRLYTAISAAISKDTLKTHFTEVTGIMGYTPKTLAGTEFAASLDTTNHWVTVSATFTWIFTAGAGLTILGWYALNGAATKAICGEQWASAAVIPAGGGTLQVNVNDKYQQC